MRVARSALCQRSVASLPRRRSRRNGSARLTGLSKQDALVALEEWLERFQLTANRHTKLTLINKGHVVVQGRVQEIKRQHGCHVARLTLDNDPEAPWLEQLPGVQATKRRQDYLELHLQANLSPNLIVEAALEHGSIISRVSIPFYLLLLVYVLLAFFLYEPLFAGLGALVKRQEEVQGAMIALFAAAHQWVAVGLSYQMNA